MRWVPVGSVLGAQPLSLPCLPPFPGVLRMKWSWLPARRTATASVVLPPAPSPTPLVSGGLLEEGRWAEGRRCELLLGDQEQLPTHPILSALGDLLTFIIVPVVVVAVLALFAFCCWKCYCCCSPGEHRLRGIPGALAPAGGSAWVWAGWEEVPAWEKRDHSAVFIFQETET